MYNSPAMMSTSRPSNAKKDLTNFSTPVTYQVTTKRKESKDVSGGPVASKRSRGCTQTKGKFFEEQLNACGCIGPKFFTVWSCRC